MQGRKNLQMRLAAFQSIVCICLRHCVIWCTTVQRGKSKAQKLFMWSREHNAAAASKTLVFFPGKNCFFNAAATTTTTQLVGRGSAKIVIPKIKQMTEREKNTKRRTCWRRNFFSRSHADKITSIQLVYSAALTNATRYLYL